MLLWAGGRIHSASEAAFFLVAASAAGYVSSVTASVAKGRALLPAVRQVAVVAVVVLVPVVFDLTAYLGWNSVKFVVVGVGAAVVAGAWACQQSGPGTTPALRNGLHWPVVAFLAWTALATVTSISPTTSLIGRYDYFNGLGLLGLFVVLFFAVASDFRATDVKPLLSATYLGAGSVVVFYGILQLHDRLTSWGGRWEWALRQATGSFDPGRVIWSTLANPNHLSGYLAILLPIGLVLAVLETSPRTRVAIGVVGAGLMIELVQTATRGAWLAAVVSVLISVVLLSREVKVGARQIAGAGLGLAAVAGLAAALSFSGHMRYSVSQLAGSTGSAGSTATERVEYWRAAITVAGSHPLVGSGPDTFASEVDRVQSAKLASLQGPEVAPDGPHNVMLDYLATLGIPGLLFFLAILGVAGWRAWRARSALLVVAENETTSDVSTRREQRFLLVAVSAALAAYVVQATFNVEQIALATMFWVLLGLLCVVTNEALSGSAEVTSRPGPTRRREEISVRQTAVGCVAVVGILAVS